MKASAASKRKDAVAALQGRQAMAFGRSYFYALGGLTPRASTSPADTEREEDTADVPCYTWTCPPWWNADKSSDNNNDDKTNPDRIVQAQATTQSTVYLTANGKIFQTGMLHGHCWPTPTPIITQLPVPCVEIAAGRHFVLGRLEGGVAVVSWGAGHFGQLGLGHSHGSDNDDGSSSSNNTTTFTAQPVVIPQLLPHATGSPVVQVAAGDWHGLALTESGRIWAWGSNRSHQCGRKPATRGGNSNSAAATTLLSPLPVPLDYPVAAVAGGKAHSVALLRDSGQVYCWGSTLHGQCGNVVRKTPVGPHAVDGLSELRFTKVAVAGNHTLALTSGGRLFTWGDNSEGQLGHSLACPAQPRSKQVHDLDFVARAAQQHLQRSEQLNAQEVHAWKKERPLQSWPKIVDIFAGAAYSVALTSSGAMYCFGSNDVGQLGLPVPPAHQLPVHDNTVPPVKNTVVHELDIQVFDSRHIVLRPMRNIVVADMFVETVACGPNHMVCLGRPREASEQENDDLLQLSPCRTDDASLSESMNVLRIQPSLRAPEASSAVGVANGTAHGQDTKSLAEAKPSPLTSGNPTTQMLPDPPLQVQTGRNPLADRLVPIDLPTPSTTADEYAAAATPSSTALAETPKSTPKSRQRRPMGVIRGLSQKFRRRFSKKKGSGAGDDEESDTETGQQQNDGDQA